MRRRKLRQVWLELTSWRGISIGAEHYYARLAYRTKKQNKTVELRQTLSLQHAEALNAKDRRASYVEGSDSGRFNSKADAIVFALQVWQQHFPKGEILLTGNGSYVEPHQMLAGPSDIMKAAEALRRFYLTLDDERAQFITTNEWRKLIGERQYKAF